MITATTTTTPAATLSADFALVTGRARIAAFIAARSSAIVTAPVSERFGLPARRLAVPVSIV